jgi:hypothetical protein
MMSYRGKASQDKKTLPGGKLTALDCHLTINVKKGANLSANIDYYALSNPVFLDIHGMNTT